MRVSLIAFLLVLALAAAGIWLYPYICLRIGTRAAQRGDTEKAVLWLSRAGQAEQPEETQKETVVLLEQAQEKEIDRLIQEEKYEDALNMLQDRASYDPEDERVKECLYGIASEYYQKENFAEAEKQFAKILSYKDANTYYQECGKHIALAAFESGDILTAQDYIAKNPLDPSLQELSDKIIKLQAQEMLQSDDPEGGLKIILELWQKGKAEDSDLINAEKACYPYLYVNMDDSEILETARKMSAEQAEKRNELIKKRNELPKQVLAVGNLHSVAVREDGTVLAAGDNFYGQCNVSGWTDIVAVAAGAFHTVGLKNDGTVVAAGDNRYGQCETQEIRDAVEIEAHGFDTIVRKGDGAVICIGEHNYSSLISGWTDISDLSAGGYALVGITDDGTAMSTSPALLTQEFRNLIAIDAATDYAAGITVDGHLVTSAISSPDWEGVLTVDAEANGLMGLMEDGSVRFALLNEMDFSLLSDRTDVIAIAYSGTHAVVLLKDGTYLACGENGSSQCSVSNWQRNG